MILTILSAGGVLSFAILAFGLRTLVLDKATRASRLLISAGALLVAALALLLLLTHNY